MWGEHLEDVERQAEENNVLHRAGKVGDLARTTAYMHPPGAGALAIALLSEVGPQPAPLCTI